VGELRHISKFEIEVDVVHDEDPDYLADLLMADVQQALRVRGCDPFGSSIGWRDPTVPVVHGADDEAAASGDTADT
jgi:hypothetical protein